jgi:hypothetical protein
MPQIKIGKFIEAIDKPVERWRNVEVSVTSFVKKIEEIYHRLFEICKD